MNRIVATVAIVAGVFLLFISEALSAPLVQLSRSTRSFNQYTCIHKTMYRKNIWKKCGRHSTMTPPLPSYNSLDIKQRLARSSSPHMQVPENGFKCWRMDRYDPNNERYTPDCPALCKLKDLKGNLCNNPLQSGMSPSGHFVIAESPDYLCSPKYTHNIMCVYNISMSCDTNHVQVTFSDVDITDNDFVQVIDHTNGQIYQPVSGSTWPVTQRSIPSSRFTLVFWSDKDSTQSRGFKLVLNCPAGSDNRNAGSGDQPNLEPENVTVQ